MTSSRVAAVKVMMLKGRFVPSAIIRS
jgi:hypothetical protein